MDMIPAKRKEVSLDRNNSEKRPLKTYRRRRLRRPTLADELVYEILLRLPVRTLARSNSVCKAWRATISDPSFTRAHLKQSASRREREPPSLLSTPHTLTTVIEAEAWPSTFSNTIPFYHWRDDGQDTASLVHATDFHREFGSVYCMVHCDGLAMLLTDARIYVFNPATGDVLKLPNGHNNDTGLFRIAGMGLDLGTNTYKVVRSFYRSVNFSQRTCDASMEVCKDSLYWHIHKDLLERPPEGFIRFDLEDGTFSFVSHPALPSEEDRLDFVELGGELCLAQYLTTQIVWKSPSGDNRQWDRVYVVNLPEAWEFRPFEFLSDRVLLRRGNCVYRYDEASRTAKEVVCTDQLRYKNPRTGSFDFVGEDFYFFNMIPYTESLIPLTKPE